MATKTISLELDAYEKLKAAKQPGDSFSDVVRRAQLSEKPKTARSLLEELKHWAGRPVLGEKELDLLEEAQKNPSPPSPSHWEGEDAG